jgi:hypothetical protein
MKEIFKSDRYFTLYDVIVSHGQLLLRSQKTDDIANNIDIVFFNTSYIQSFSRLNGVRINILKNATDTICYNTVKKYLDYDNNYLFEIESNDEKYYIAASFVKVFENNLEFHETSLGIGIFGRENEIASSDW